MSGKLNVKMKMTLDTNDTNDTNDTFLDKEYKLRERFILLEGEV